MKWDMFKLNEICEVSGGTTPKTNKPEYWNGNITWLSPVDLPEVGSISNVFTSQRKITEQGVKESGLKILPKGSLVFSTRASIGKIGIVQEPLTTNQGFTNLIPSSRINVRYLAYALKKSIPEIEQLGNTTTFKEVSRTAIKNFKIPVPPLHIQEQIADTLEKADALRRKDQELLDKYNELAQAIFYDMFGDTLLNNKKWEDKNVSELITFMTSGSRGWATYYSETGELFLRINNVKNGTLFLDDVVYVNPPDTAESKRTLVKPRDVLLSITADLGRTAVVPDTIKKAYINQHLALLRLNNKINPYYLAHFINSRGGQEQIRKGNKGGVKAGLNFNDIKELSILVPPTQLQNQFENAIKKLRLLIDVHKKNSSLPINLFNTLSIKYFS